jgi:hypothetical protein
VAGTHTRVRTHCHRLGVKWSQVQILSARPQVKGHFRDYRNASSMGNTPMIYPNAMMRFWRPCASKLQAKSAGQARPMDSPSTAKEVVAMLKYFHRGRPDGLYSWCKGCVRGYQRAHRYWMPATGEQTT